MAIRVVEFSNGGTKLERFCPKKQHTRTNLLNFEIWVNGAVSKVPKFDFQSKLLKLYHILDGVGQNYFYIHLSVG